MPIIRNTLPIALGIISSSKVRDAQVIFMRNRKGEVTYAIMRINGPIRAMRVK